MTDSLPGAQRTSMLNRLRRLSLLSALVPAFIATGIACTAESNLGDYPASGGPPTDPADPGAVDPIGNSGNGDGVDAASAPKDSGAPPKLPDGGPSTNDSGTKDASQPVGCAGKAFLIAKVVPMPSGYTVAGFGSASASLYFTTQANPRKLYLHSIADVATGNLQVLGEDSFYHPEEVISSVAGGFFASLSARRITAVTNGGLTTYRVRAGSDANLDDFTGNLPTLDATSRITSMYRWNAGGVGKTGLFVVRAGAEVYSKPNMGLTWSLVATLSGSGTSAWEGLALTSDPTTALRFFFKATIAGGQQGIVEQRWPNALASDAEAPVLVFANANATPFGVSDDGCNLYASRLNGSTLEIVIYTR